MNMCDLYLEHLSAYLDGELSETESKKMEEHMQACEACSEQYAILKTIISGCCELEEELPDGFESSLHQRLEAANVIVSGRRKAGKIRIFTQIAAGFILVVALGLFLRMAFNPPPNSTSEFSAAEKAPSPAKEQRLDGQEPGVDVDSKTTESVPLSMMRAEIPEEVDANGYTGEEGTFTSKTTGIATAAAADVQPEAFVQFSESVGINYDKVEGQDTRVMIQTDDTMKAIEAIQAIETKLGETDSDNLKRLKESLDIARGAPQEPIEVKLLYTNDELWQEFLGDLQAFFPDMTVESSPATEELEHIRVFIEAAE